MSYLIYQVGDRALGFSIGDTINPENYRKLLAMKQWIHEHAWSGLEDIVIAYNSLTIFYDPLSLRQTTTSGTVSDHVKHYLQQAYERSGDSSQQEPAFKKVPVCYEEPFSPDMDFVSSSRNISAGEIISLHTSTIYSVYMIGFLPGFPYMAEVNSALVVPRKEKPRARIEAGSVGLAGSQTGIYPVVSPGGWQIIGRTPLTLFNKENYPPSFFEPGDRVQFYSISKQEFEQFPGSAR